MIKWIIPDKIGTAPASFVSDRQDLSIIDVRDLVDRDGNAPHVLKKKIKEGVESLQGNKPTIICCDYGISRSNAIAAAILSQFNQKPFSAVIKEVINITGEKEIKSSVLETIFQALNECPPQSGEKNGKQHILITGSTGFIGSVLVKKLPETYHLFTPLSMELNLLEGSAELDIYVKENKITRIIHLANPRIYVSNKAMGNTLSMLRNVLEVCSNNKVTLIYPSSWEIYSGYRSSHLLASEALPPNPKGSYGETKWLCEMLINSFQKQHGLRCVLLRSSPVYGVASDRPKFIWSFIDSAIKGLPIKTHNFLNGSPALDLLHIDDLCAAIITVLEKEFIGEINLGTGRLLSTREIARIICDKLSSDSPVIPVDILAYAPNIAMDNTFAESVIGWKPHIAFEDSIGDLITSRKKELWRIKG
jgi:UDP-glucuronate decarboxylase